MIYSRCYIIPSKSCWIKPQPKQDVNLFWAPWKWVWDLKEAVTIEKSTGNWGAEGGMIFPSRNISWVEVTWDRLFRLSTPALTLKFCGIKNVMWAEQKFVDFKSLLSSSTCSILYFDTLSKHDEPWHSSCPQLEISVFEDRGSGSSSPSSSMSSAGSSTRWLEGQRQAYGYHHRSSGTLTNIRMLKHESTRF